MLDTLHRIVKEVNAASDLDQALRLIVGLVKQAIRCDVCSVYLTDADARAYVLAATDGLRQEAVGKVRYTEQTSQRIACLTRPTIRRKAWSRSDAAFTSLTILCSVSSMLSVCVGRCL